MSNPTSAGGEQPAVFPQEARRLAALRALEVLDTPPEPEFDDITALVADICETPIALISLVDESRQWFKSAVGLTASQTPREVAFCAHALDNPDLLLVPDATQDGRFADNPLVTGEPHIRFYAGAPLVTPDGHTLGTLCVIDRVPRQLAEPQLRALRVLGRQVMTELTLRHRLREQEKAEQALRRSEMEQRELVRRVEEQRARLVEAQAVAKVGSWETDMATYVVVWSQETHRIFETDPATFQPTHAAFLQHVHPADRAAVDRAFVQSKAQRGIQQIEHRVLLPGGRIKFIEERWRMHFDDQDRPIRAVGTCRDITERVQAGLEASRANRALRMLSRCNEALIRAENERRLLNDVCAIAVEVGGFRFAWVGYAQEDEAKSIVPQAHAGHEEGYLAAIQLSWAEDRPGGQGPAARAIRTGKPVVISDLTDPRSGFLTVAEAGARGYRGVICLPLQGETRVFGMLALYLDDSRAAPEDELGLLQELADDMAFGINAQRLRAERRLAQQELAQQAALLDKAQDAILVRDMTHRITYWNKSAERLYGWKPAEAVGRSVRELLYFDPAVFDRAMERLRQEGEWSGELIQQHKDGGQLMIEGRWTLVRDDAGQPRSVLAINTDITERKKLEQQFLRAQRMESIGTLAGGIAHDLNNLLAPITMGVDLLKLFEPNPKSLPVIENIERSAKRGADLVRQVLSFARGVEGARVTLQVRHVLKEVESIVGNTFPKNIAVEVRVAPDLGLVLADPTQLNQVLLNLCVNARDAMPDGGQLQLKAANIEIDQQYAVMNRGVMPGRYVVIEVTDNGCGMPQSIIDRIFEPFFTTKEMGKGTGLGLSTVLGIVRSHGGFVNVYSEPGKGSTFKVYLPLQAEGRLADVAGEGEGVLPRGNGELIMVVDDETSVLDITKQTLLAFGYRVVTAEDGAQAIGLYALQRDEIALVLTDMMMPVMDGPVLITALRRIHPQVRVIAASGLNANGNVARAAAAGVADFLAKPYTADALLRLVRKVLRETGSRPPH